MSRLGVAFWLALPLVASSPSSALAQGWDADLMIDPFPSPYFSDWEASASVASFTVFNNTGAEGSVRLTFSITQQSGGVLASGLSDPVALPPGPNLIDSPFQLSGSFDYDVGIQDIVVRTGRFPEGDYTACAAVTDLSGFVLTEACSTFSIVYPDPPMLLSPFDGERVTTPDPFFEWTPLQVPFDYPVQFALQIAEVLPGQTPQQALTSNIPQLEQLDLISTSIQYPLGALPFEAGTRYAWRVQAIDGNGYAASANDGMSEIHTFVYVEGTEAVAHVRISPAVDTLTFSGDTARLEATAYDEYDFELLDPEFEWTSSDTSVAKVDSLGRITSVGEGEAEIIAVADGVADTARAVALAGGGMGLRITFYDPETETPDLWSLLRSASYEEVAEWLDERMRRGRLELPLPAIAGLAGGAGAGLDREGEFRYAAGPGRIEFARGPSEPGGAAPVSGPLSAACGSLTLPFRFYADKDRQALAIHLLPPVETAAARVNSLFSCLGIAEWTPDRPGQKLELLFSAVWPPDEGSAQVFLGVKLPFVGLFENQPGVHLNYAVLVYNFWRGFEVDASKLPDDPEVAAFYPHKFKVKGVDVEVKAEKELGGESKAEGQISGRALNFYGRLDLRRTPIVGLLDVLGFQDPVIELQGDLSSSVGGEATKQGGTAKIARKLHIEGRLPKRVPRAGHISRYINSTQVGIELDIELEDEQPAASPDTGASKSAGKSTTKVTPKLTHTIDLQLPFPNWPPLSLKGSVAWSHISESEAGASRSDTAATRADTSAAKTDSTATSGGGGTPAKSKWVLAYEVGTGEDSTIVLWDFLRLKVGAEVAYTQSTSASPAAWELKLSGTTGFGSADEAATVSVAYERESANCGGKNQPPCKTPPPSPTGQPQPPELSKKQDKGQWKLMIESKGIAFDALFKDLRRLINAIR